MENLDPQPPPRLLHFHIFKNGGSTLDWILRRNFSGGFSEAHGPEANSTLFVEDIQRMLKEHPDQYIFSSHHFRFPVNELDDVLPLAFIRHPLDRVPSIYEQERRSSINHLKDPAFTSFSAWTEIALQKRSPLLCDAQVSFFARGGIYYEPPTEACLQEAIELIDSLDFVGIVSEYEKSMVLLEDLLHRWWPKFDAAYFIQNHSAREPTLEERLNRLERLLEPSTYARLLLNNAYDLALFEHARSRMLERTHALPDFEQRLTDLRSRCQSLR